MGTNFMNSGIVHRFGTLKAFKGKGETPVFPLSIRRIGAVVLGLAGALGATGSWAITDAEQAAGSVAYAAVKRLAMVVTESVDAKGKLVLNVDVAPLYAEDVGKPALFLVSIVLPLNSPFANETYFNLRGDGKDVRQSGSLADLLGYEYSPFKFASFTALSPTSNRIAIPLGVSKTDAVAFSMEVNLFYQITPKESLNWVRAAKVFP